MFKPDDRTMFGLRSTAISHAHASVLKTGGTGVIKCNISINIGRNYDKDAYSEGIRVSCNSYYCNGGTDFENCNNVLINIRSGNDSSFFIDIFKDQISYGVCGSDLTKYTNFEEFEDLDVLRNGSDEARFQHSTMWSIGDLTQSELQELLEIADLIPLGRDE